MMTETVLFFKDLNHLIAVYHYIALELFLTSTCKCGSRHRNDTTMKKLIVLIRACE